ncbi:MAG: chromate transporter, partial [Proteobacteria bacterium]|nr:chromate transporter [Pseudomonadota bacterium]
PGPEAQQLAVYIGWLLHRTKGGLTAGLLFVLPGALALMGLSWIYAVYGNVGIIQALFFGLKAAVLAIVLEAVLRIGRRALKNRVMLAIAATAFVAIFFFKIAFPYIIIAAGLLGYIGGRVGLKDFLVEGNSHKSFDKTVADADSALGLDTPAHAKPSWTRTLIIAAIGFPLWLGPVATLWLMLGPHDVFTDTAVFFSKMAVVTFGGAYAVLAYVAQEAVQHYGWLRPGEMLDGLGMAETTPGPLIMVTQFVGFMAAFRNASGFAPMLAGTLGGLLTTWVTFVPCFIWIFLGAPHIEVLRSNKALSTALAAITAAVVGVILNLAVWFALHVLFGVVNDQTLWGVLTLPVPDLASFSLAACIFILAALLMIFRFKAGMMVTLASCAGVSVVWYLLRAVMQI